MVGKASASASSATTTDTVSNTSDLSISNRLWHISNYEGRLPVRMPRSRASKCTHSPTKLPKEAKETRQKELNKVAINNQKDKIAYVPLYPVADYVYIVDLNTRLRVGWKTLPNLNFKLKFQTKIFPVLPGNPVFW